MMWTFWSYDAEVLVMRPIARNYTDAGPSVE